MDGGLVRDHEHEKHQNKRDAPRRPTGPVEGLPLRQGDQERDPTPVDAAQPVDDQEQHKRRHHEEELDLFDQSLERRLVAHVPGEANEQEECEEEEA